MDKRETSLPLLALPPAPLAPVPPAPAPAPPMGMRVVRDEPPPSGGWLCAPCHLTRDYPILSCLFCTPTICLPLCFKEARGRWG